MFVTDLCHFPRGQSVYVTAIQFETAGWHGNVVHGCLFSCRKPESASQKAFSSLSLNLSLHHNVPIAQIVEHGANNSKVMGSIPKKCINECNAKLYVFHFSVQKSMLKQL